VNLLPFKAVDKNLNILFSATIIVQTNPMHKGGKELR